MQTFNQHRKAVFTAARRFSGAWTCSLLALIQAHAAAAPGLAEDEPVHWGLGRSRNMVSEEKSLPDGFDPQSGRNIRWTADLGTSTYSTPVVAKGRVFIGTNNGKPRDRRHTGDRGVLMVFDEQTGRLLWQLVIPKLPRDPYLDCPGVGLTSTPAIEGDRVYLVSNRAEILCLDIHGMANGNDGPFLDEGRHATPLNAEQVETGELDADILWIADLRSEAGAYPHDSSNISVLIHNDFIYASNPSGVDYTHRRRPSPDAPGLVVLDKHTGRLAAWDDTGIGARVFHSTFSSPSLGEVNGKPEIIYGGGDGVVYAFDALAIQAAQSTTNDKPAILKQIWSFDCDPAGPKQNISQYQGNRNESPSSIVGMPVFKDNRVYVAAGGDPWHGKRQCWLHCIDATKAGDATRTASVWTYPMSRHCIATPSVSNGMVFIADMGKTVHCVDASNGKPFWTHELDDEAWGSTLAADGKLYVGTHGGVLWILAAQREKKVLGRVELDSGINGSPVAANGALYVATMNRLYAIRQSSADR